MSARRNTGIVGLLAVLVLSCLAWPAAVLAAGTASIGGVVSTSDGEALTNETYATLYSYNGEWWQWKSELPLGSGEGAYSFTGLDAGTYQVRFGGYDSPYCMEFYSGVYAEWPGAAGATDIVLRADEASTTIDATLKPRPSISGIVSAPGGGPLLGSVGVRLQRHYDDSTEWHDIGIETQATSFYSLSRLEPGTYRIAVHDEAHMYANATSEAFTVGPATSVTVPTVSLQLDGRIVGKVCDGQGNPLVGAHVWLITSMNTENVVWGGQTTTGGTFSIPGSPGLEQALLGDYMLAVTASGYETRFLGGTEGPNGARVLSMEIGKLILDANVVLPDDGAVLVGTAPSRVSSLVTHRVLSAVDARVSASGVMWSNSNGALTFRPAIGSAYTTENAPFDLNETRLLIGKQVLGIGAYDVLRTIDIPGVLTGVACDDNYACYLYEVSSSGGPTIHGARMVRLSDWAEKDFTLASPYNTWQVLPGGVEAGQAVVFSGDNPVLLDFSSGSTVVVPALGTYYPRAVMAGGSVYYTAWDVLMRYDPASGETTVVADAPGDRGYMRVVSDGRILGIERWGLDTGYNSSDGWYGVYDTVSSVITTASFEPGPFDPNDRLLVDVSGTSVFRMSGNGETSIARVERLDAVTGANSLADDPVFEAADHLRPVVDSGSVFLLDNRDYPSSYANQRRFDLYEYSSTGETLVAPATNHFQANLPQASKDFVVWYATSSGYATGSMLQAMDRRSKEITTVASDLEWNTVTAELDGDWFFYAQDKDEYPNPIVPGVLTAVNLRTGQRVVAPIPVSWDLHFRVSDGWAIYHRDGGFELWNVITGETRSIPAEFNLDRLAAFDYPYVAYVDEYSVYGGVGPLRVLNVETGRYEELAPFVDLHAGAAEWDRMGALDIFGDIVVAGNHLYRVGSSDRYHFDWNGSITAIDLNATDLVFESEYAVYRTSFDLLSPTTKVVGLDAGWVNHDVVLSIEATDVGSGVDEITYSVTPPVGVVSSVTTETNPVDLAAITDEGTSTLKYRAVDADGNLSAEKTAYIRIDKTPPSRPLAPIASPTGQTSVAIAWIPATDVLSGVTGYQVFQGTTKVAEVIGTTYTRTGLAAGTAYSFTIKAVDAAGNVSEASDTAAATTLAGGGGSGGGGGAGGGGGGGGGDTDKPVTTFSASPSGWTNGAVTVTLAAADASGVDAIYYTLNGGAETKYSAPFTVEAQGTVVQYWSVDKAATPNTEDKRAETVRIDKTAPTAPEAPSYTSLTADAVSLSWAAATDTPSGVVSYDLYDGVAKVASVAGTTYSLSGLVPGSEHAYALVAVDAAGNRSIRGTVLELRMPFGEGSGAVGAGPDVAVTVKVPVSDGTSLPVSVVISSVTRAGELVVTRAEDPPHPADAGFKFLGVYWDVSFGGTFSGSIKVTFPYDPALSDSRAANLRLKHWTSRGWEEVPVTVDLVNHTITGTLTSLSPVVLAEDATVNRSTTVVLAKKIVPTVYGKAAGVVARLVDASGSVVAGQRTLVLEAQRSDGIWSQVATMAPVPGKPGSYSARAKPLKASGPTSIRVRFAGDAMYDASEYVTALLYPQVKLTAKAPTSGRRTTPVAVSGTIAAHTASTRVALVAERMVGSRVVSRITNTIALSARATTFATTFPLRTAGTWRVRATTLADSGHGASTSTARLVRVR